MLDSTERALAAGFAPVRLLRLLLNSSGCSSLIAAQGYVLNLSPAFIQLDSGRDGVCGTMTQPSGYCVATLPNSRLARRAYSASLTSGIATAAVSQSFECGLSTRSCFSWASTLLNFGELAAPQRACVADSVQAVPFGGLSGSGPTSGVLSRTTFHSSSGLHRALCSSPTPRSPPTSSIMFRP